MLQRLVAGRRGLRRGLCASSTASSDDGRQWLEGVLDEAALSWVREQNRDTLARLGEPTASPMYERVLGILEDRRKIPMVTKIDDLLYNFWTDDQHSRGT